MERLKLLQKRYRQSRKCLKEAENIVGELMALHWNSLEEMRKLFKILPDRPIKMIVYKQIQLLESKDKQ